MLDSNDRIIVESIRNAPRLKIVIIGGDYEGQIAFAPNRKLNHDIALAVQSYYNQIRK